MTTRERIDGDYIVAAKARDAESVSYLRQLRSTLKNAEIEKMKPLEEAEVIEMIGREVKKLKDASESFRVGERPDLQAGADAEVTFLTKYLPEQLTDDEIAKVIADTIASLAPVTIKDFGRVMGEVTKATKGRADGGKVSAAVKEILANVA